MDILVSPPRSQLRVKRPWKYKGLGEDGISLGLAEIDFDVPEPVKKAMVDAVLKEEFHYTSLEGLQEFLQAVVDRWERFNHVSIGTENVLPTVGAMNGIWLASRVLLKPRDEVIVVTPTYGPILRNFASSGARVIICPSCSEDYHLDLEEIENKISKRTKMIAICNPNNPTGVVYTRNELEYLADLARKNKIYVFSDELYDLFTYDGRKHVSMFSLLGMDGLAIIVNGLTKAYGLSGLRIGYVVADKKIIDKMREINTLIIIHPNVLGQKAAAFALNECDEWMRCLISHCEKMRNLLCDALDRLEGVSCPRSEGTFFAFPNIYGIFNDDIEAARILEREYKLRVSAGSGYGKGGENHLRLNFATTEPIIRESIKRFKRFFRSFKEAR